MTYENKKILDKASQMYLENTILRASLQAIPYGSVVDTLLTGKATKIQNQRLNSFLEQLNHRLEKIEKFNVVDEDNFFDLLRECIEKAVRTRHDEKRKLFVNIIGNHLLDPDSTEKAEMAVRIVSALDLIHFKILKEALDAPEAGGSFSTLKVITITNTHPQSTKTREDLVGVVLDEKLNEYPLEAIRYAISELISKSLMHDEGIGRWDTASMQYFVATDTAKWVYKWILE